MFADAVRSYGVNSNTSAISRGMGIIPTHEKYAVGAHRMREPVTN